MEAADCVPMASLDTLNFDNRFARLADAFYSRVAVTPFEEPARLLSFSEAVAASIGLAQTEFARADLAAIIGGETHWPGTEPLAMVYAGHQFGHFVPQLGDGRAILLGQVRCPDGKLRDLQLKGAGQTAYSRQGDGRAVLRSSIREYLCSEAMAGLGIPTTRALCLLGSDEEVYRERIEPGAMVLRVAESHIRFGHFEYFFYSNQHARLAELADYLIGEHFPDIPPSSGAGLGAAEDAGARYAALLDIVIERTAALIAQWQSVGFAHGVMNSDNMSMLGLTLDYGPFGFLDSYEPGFICNHSDHHGRYAFDQQPQIGQFNLACLAQAMLPLLDPVPEAAAEQAQALIDSYPRRYRDQESQRMSAKLGLLESRAGDDALIGELLGLLAEDQADYTIFFRALSDEDGLRQAREHVLNRARFDAWATDYRSRLAQQAVADDQRAHRMRAVNPKYVLRNHLAQIAIERAEQGDASEINRLLTLLARPFDEQPEFEGYAAYPPDWARRITVSCSS